MGTVEFFRPEAAMPPLLLFCRDKGREALCAPCAAIPPLPLPLLLLLPWDIEAWPDPLGASLLLRCRFRLWRLWKSEKFTTTWEEKRRERNTRTITDTNIYAAAVEKEKQQKKRKQKTNQSINQPNNWKAKNKQLKSEALQRH